MNWTGNKYELPGKGPGLLTRAWWFLEDWWRELDGEEKTVLGLVVLAMALMIVTLRFGP